MSPHSLLPPPSWSLWSALGICKRRVGWQSTLSCYRNKSGEHGVLFWKIRVSFSWICFLPGEFQAPENVLKAQDFFSKKMWIHRHTFFFFSPRWFLEHPDWRLLRTYTMQNWILFQSEMEGAHLAVPFPPQCHCLWPLAWLNGPCCHEARFPWQCGLGRAHQGLWHLLLFITQSLVPLPGDSLQTKTISFPSDKQIRG